MSRSPQQHRAARLHRRGHTLSNVPWKALLSFPITHSQQCRLSCMRCAVTAPSPPISSLGTVSGTWALHSMRPGLTRHQERPLLQRRPCLQALEAAHRAPAARSQRAADAALPEATSESCNPVHHRSRLLSAIVTDCGSEWPMGSSVRQDPTSTQGRVIIKHVYEGSGSCLISIVRLRSLLGVWRCRVRWLAVVLRALQSLSLERGVWTARHHHTAGFMWRMTVLVGVHLLLRTAGRLPRLGAWLRWAGRWLVLRVTVF